MHTLHLRHRWTFPQSAFDIFRGNSHNKREEPGLAHTRGFRLLGKRKRPPCSLHSHRHHTRASTNEVWPTLAFHSFRQAESIVLLGEIEADVVDGAVLQALLHLAKADALEGLEGDTAVFTPRFSPRATLRVL